MADGEYMRFAHGRCSLPALTTISGTKPNKRKGLNGECAHEKPAFSNGKLRKHCFDCCPKPEPTERKPYTWAKTERKACKCCGNEFGALGLNLYCSAQCKKQWTAQAQLIKDKARQSLCSGCGAARSRAKPEEVSPLCWGCYRKSVGYAPSVVRRCLWCLTTYVPKDAKVRLGKTGGWFCSRECSFADRSLHGAPSGLQIRAAWANYGSRFATKTPKEIASTVCKICAVETGRPKAEACHGACEDRWARVRNCVYPVLCKFCGTSFCRLPGLYTRHCSDECHATSNRNAKKRSRRIEKGVRRARMRGSISETFDPIVVLDRDRWRCQLCGVKTPKANRGSIDANAPELDHIIPLSKGGGHTRANTQCLCRRCNQTKRDTARGQLWLIP